MVHEARLIELGDGVTVSIGFTSCFSSPAVAVAVLRRSPQNAPQLVATLSLSPTEVDTLITALQQVRAALPRGGP
jgi:hypothetical protein